MDERLQQAERVDVGCADLRGALGMASNLAQAGWVQRGYRREGALWVVTLAREKADDAS